MLFRFLLIVILLLASVEGAPINIQRHNSGPKHTLRVGNTNHLIFGPCSKTCGIGTRVVYSTRGCLNGQDKCLLRTEQCEGPKDCGFFLEDGIDTSKIPSNKVIICFVVFTITIFLFGTLIGVFCNTIRRHLKKDKSRRNDESQRSTDGVRETRAKLFGGKNEDGPMVKKTDDLENTNISSLGADYVVIDIETDKDVAIPSNNKPEMLPAAKRAAIENVTDLLREVIPEIATPQVEMLDIRNQENNLPPEILTILQSKGEEGYLVEEIIIMAQDLLQSQFKGFDGLQPPCALMEPGYSVLKNAVQIHYDEDREHWLTTCYKNGQIFVADSVREKNPSPSISQQITNMYSEVVDNPLKHLRFIDVDQQNNDYDCGLYAIAFAYELMADDGEPTANFQRQKMRTHLISCLQKNRISGFPKKVRK